MRSETGGCDGFSKSNRRPKMNPDLANKIAVFRKLRIGAELMLNTAQHPPGRGTGWQVGEKIILIAHRRKKFQARNLARQQDRLWPYAWCGDFEPYRELATNERNDLNRENRRIGCMLDLLATAFSQTIGFGHRGASIAPDHTGGEQQ